MQENSVHIRLKDRPVLIDKVLQDLQKAFMEKLPWLNYAFGRAYRITEPQATGPSVSYPAVYNGNAEYVSMLPNDNLGNFSWFDIYDPQEVTRVTQALPQYTVKGSVIFWYNLTSIYADDLVLRTEEIKESILSLLTTPGIIKNTGHIEVNRVYERLENIYKAEEASTIERQFFMYPYAGLRIEFSITTRELCPPYMK